jgi:hypothetical protein
MSDYFEQLIAGNVESGTITAEQADMLREFLQVITPEQQSELQAGITAEPRLFSFLVDNIEKKIRAINSGDMEVWNWVVEDELRQLDALE